MGISGCCHSPLSSPLHFMYCSWAISRGKLLIPLLIVFFFCFGTAREADGVFPWCIGDWSLSIDFPFLSFVPSKKMFLFLVSLSYLLISCVCTVHCIYIGLGDTSPSMPIG